VKKKTNRKETIGLADKLKSVWVFGLIGIILIYLIYVGLERQIRTTLLNKYSLRTKGIIIDEKHYWGNSPVSGDFSYYFKFTVDNKVYKGKSWDKGLTVGDSLEIDYVEFYPDFNRPTGQSE
jgi:hypothetical protein